VAPVENKFTRRTILKSALFTGFFLPFSYALSVSVGDYVHRENLKYLTDKEATIFESAADVIIPEGNAIGLSIYDINIAQALDEYMAILPQSARERLSMLLWTVEHLFPVRRFYFKKFSRLSFERRQLILESFDASGGAGGRALIRALKGLAQTLYYNHPKVQEKVGFVDRCAPA
jgi:hypothetical protein